MTQTLGIKSPNIGDPFFFFRAYAFIKKKNSCKVELFFKQQCQISIFFFFFSTLNFLDGIKTFLELCWDLFLVLEHLFKTFEKI